MKILSIVKKGLFIGIAFIIDSQTFAQSITSPSEPLVAHKIMLKINADMQIIKEAINAKDWLKIKSTALQIASQRQPPLGEKLRIVAFIGSDLPEFKGLDAKKQVVARAIVESAKQKDISAVMANFVALENTCLECHQIFLKPFQNYFYGEY